MCNSNTSARWRSTGWGEGQQTRLGSLDVGIGCRLTDGDFPLPHPRGLRDAR